MKRSRNHSSRRLHLERLEGRDLFSRDIGAFAGFGSMTFSYAPDGARVGQETSELAATLDAVATTTEWQAAIERAIQTWAIHSNINFGRVPDNGAASGVYGPLRGDERFGDVRISAFDFALDSIAEAVSDGARSAGAWAGDVFFNSKAKWDSLQAIEAVALHEVGHVLGLDHSSDPNSPMHAHGPSGILQLTANDIALLHEIHGPRIPDPNEGDHGNDTIGRASEIKGGEDDETVAEGFNGEQVWIQFGDLLDAADRDVFAFKTALGYSGPVAVEVRSAGISLSQLKAQITDKHGNALQQAVMVGSGGGVAKLVLNATMPDAKYYVHVLAGDDPFWATGDYSVTIANPTTLQSKGEVIADWSRTAHRWYYDSKQAKNGFSWQLLRSAEDEPTTHDQHSDDSIQNAVDLPQMIDVPTRVVYRTVGTVSDLIDIDHYRVNAPKNLLGRNELTVDLESLSAGGLVPGVDVLDAAGNVRSADIRIQGFGQTQLVLSNVQSEERFFVRLRGADVAQEFRTGSFSLSVTFAPPTNPPEVLLQGSLTAAERFMDREWYVARPQLFAFSLLGATTAFDATTQIWVSIFDANRRLVAGLVAPNGQLRSAPALFLDAGAYFFQVAASNGSGELSDTSFQFRVDRPSKPIGPLIGNKAVQPLYLNPGSTTEYLYPNSTTPTTRTQQVGPPPPQPLPAPSNAPIASPSAWFWRNQFLPTNPSNAMDVDGDATVSPLDVLVIINAINSAGIGPVPPVPMFLGHIDVNANGTVEPLDVLNVINFING